MKNQLCYILLLSLSLHQAIAGDPVFNKVKKQLKEKIISRGNYALTQMPVTITTAKCERSAGGLHDFYSEGDYWWPNPEDPNGPYIQRDGLTNPGNFTAHRKAMVRFSQLIGSLASAYLVTNNQQYVRHAFLHLNAWLVDEATLMNPSLLYAQAIRGKVTGRSIGIIDMIQMMEVAQGVLVMEKATSVNQGDLQKIKKWFAEYLRWVTTHEYGIAERDAKNNHGTCWVMQVAVFARLVSDRQLIEECSNRFKTILLPGQMDPNGSFPLELKRTKPYGYSLFNLDAMTTICQVLSTEKEDLWDFKLADGCSMKNAVDFMFPFVENKQRWTYPPDIMYWNNWPVAQPFLIFGYKKYRDEKWFDTWKKLEHFPQEEEVVRNLPVRNPLIWLQ